MIYVKHSLILKTDEIEDEPLIADFSKQEVIIDADYMHYISFDDFIEFADKLKSMLESKSQVNS